MKEFSSRIFQASQLDEKLNPEKYPKKLQIIADKIGPMWNTVSAGYNDLK